VDTIVMEAATILALETLLARVVAHESGEYAQTNVSGHCRTKTIEVGRGYAVRSHHELVRDARIRPPRSLERPEVNRWLPTVPGERPRQRAS